MRVAFVLQDLQLSGGVGVVVEHAAQLRRHHGFDARLVIARPRERPDWAYRGLSEVPVLSFEEAAAVDWDVAVSTWWETAAEALRLRARRHACFVQLLEDSTYAPRAPERMAGAMATGLPVRFITEARWIAELIEDLQPGTQVLYARNGVAKDVFRSPERVAPALPGEPLRIVLEGARHYVAKGVDEALAAVAAMREPAHVTWVSPSGAGSHSPAGVDAVLSGLSHAEMAQLLSEQHVILKLSRAEGMYGPPLEAFHMGATVVTTAVTGHDEYVAHGVNGLVVGWDDPRGTARALDLLARDRRLLHELRCGALATARAWPDWREASQWMALALRRVVAEPAPTADGAAVRLASDLASMRAELGMVRWRLDNLELERRQLAGQRAVRYALAARRRLDWLRAKARGARRRVGRLMGR